MITGPHRVLSSRARLDGRRAAMDTAGVRADPELICEGDFPRQTASSTGGGCCACPTRLPPSSPATTCRLSGSTRRPPKLTFAIPRSLSVVGFDDLPLAQSASPPLTTVRQPLAEMAATATTMAIALARGEPPQQERIEFATGLVVRASTAPPAA